MIDTSMAPSHLLPFKVGQQAESKSFDKGYRSAWFRCKINKLIPSKDPIKALLEFYDYPDEKRHLTQLYQKPPKNYSRSTDERRAQLVLRPCFPPLYRKNQMANLSTMSDLIVIIDDVWKVGDLVDWWSEGCYWSGKVTHLLGKDKVRVELPDPPIGEGKSYEAPCNDLRPSLNWSLEHGWTVPANDTSDCCARLVWPQFKDDGGNENCTQASDTTGFASGKIHSSASARLSVSLLPQTDNEWENYKLLECGVCASCDTGASVSSSTLASTLLFPTGNVDPHVNETSRHCSSAEDNEKDMEVQSTKMSLDLVDDIKEIASGSDKISCTIAAASSPLEVNEISRSDSGREETEREIEVQSTNMNLDSDDCRRGKAGIFETCRQGSGKEENKTAEVQSTNIIVDLDAGRMRTMSSPSEALVTTCSSLLAPSGFITAEMNEVPAQSCRMEVTELSAEIQPTIVNLVDSDSAGKETTGRFANSFNAPGALFFSSLCDSPETNDTSVQKLVMGKNKKEIQSMNMILDTEDGKKQTTNFFYKASGLHEVISPSDVRKFSGGEDQHNFRQLPKRKRITENVHPYEVAEANAIESSVLELEELANKIKWLKGLIIFGLRWSNAMKPTWKFSES